MAAATPYALGRFRAHTDFGPRADDFTGVIIESEAAPLAALLPAAPDLDALLADWPANSKLLGDAVEESRTGQRWASLARPVSDFTRLAPLRPGQIFQSGANYKTHVVQLMMASAAEKGDDIKDRAEVQMVRHGVVDDDFRQLMFQGGGVEQDHAVAEAGASAL